MPRIDTAFPAGNLCIEHFDGLFLRARPDLRDTTQPWFWWCFRIRDPAPQMTVQIGGDIPAFGPLGPACSVDGGHSWQWLGAAACTGDSFDWQCPDGCDDVRFAMAMPYTLANWQAFAATRPWLVMNDLCHTRRGRVVPMAWLGPADAAHRILLTARHHACESAASFVLEGFLDGWQADADLRQHSRILLVPMVDLDGVEDGDQGKSRHPHDHNRDYRGDPIHPETIAIQQLATAWAAGRLTLGLDLHSPWILHTWNEHVYGVGNRDSVLAEAQRALLDAWQVMHAVQCDGGETLPIGPNRLLPVGTAWNTDPHEWKCSSFADRLGGIGLSIEFPYAGVRPDGLSDLDDTQALVPVTPDRLRGLGRSLAQATAVWLANRT